MKTILRIKQLFILVAFISACFTGYSQFKADMYYTMGGKERVFKVFSDNENYRYEFDEAGQKGVVISKSGSNEIIILMPQQLIAMKSLSGSPMTMASDPLKVYEYYHEEGSVREIGKETVNGIECVKSELWNEVENANQKMFTIWYSEKYKFPVKITNHIDVTGPSGMELKNLEPWIPEPDSFTVPEGYNIMDVPQAAPQN